MSAVAFVALVTLLAAASACSSGKQTLGYELDDVPRDAALPAGDGGASGFAADVHLPWYGGPAYHARWPNGLPPSLAYVPIGVWMQNPEQNAARFRDVGVNLFLGLWEGPTDAQLDALPAPGITTFCAQSGVWESRLDEPAISGWMHDDSPDNAQERSDGSYGPCIEPEVSQQQYAQMTMRDPSRPVLLLLGQGVADAEWPGRGSCTGRNEMYAEYAQAADVLAFYSYPLARGRPIELIATGVENLLGWSGRAKPLIALVEASSIEGAPRPTPEQLRAEVWLALVRGAAGIAYYCHRFMPDFSETDCLDDDDTRAALARINGEIASLAPALNSPMIGNGVTVAADVTIATRLTRVSGITYLFAVSLSPEPASARFSLRGFGVRAAAEVIGERRTLDVTAGELVDAFDGYDVHLYRIAQ
jgi:hypothetical protein